MTNIPLAPDDLFARLDELEIEHKTSWHEAVFTVDQSDDLHKTISGGHTKNLFLKDKKSNYFLITLESNAVIDLKKIHTLIGAKGRVSFGNEERLMEYLGVKPGSVTAFSLINDVEQNVTMIIEESLLLHDKINAHPLINEATTTIGKDDLIRFIRETGHEPNIIKLTE